MEKKHIVHLYNRFAFGITTKQLHENPLTEFQSIIKSEKIYQSERQFGELEKMTPNILKKQNRQDLNKKTSEGIRKLNLDWINTMIHGESPFREKVNLFWHHHFACEIKNPIFARAFSNTIRKHSFGNFRDLLLEISKSAAMIAYLNLRQNKKQSPNEDFARELCELFTLGEGKDYTEQDVKEIARAFTGWSHDYKGNFRLRRNIHDRGEKTIFGKTDKFSGEEVIDLILEKKSCAQFIAANVYEFFVNSIPSENEIKEIANLLYNTNYNLMAMFEHITHSKWFYADHHRMTRIKSPIELIVDLGRRFRLESESEEAWIILQRVFDHTLYRPPNVAGWKVDKEWINSNSLALRLQLPYVFLKNSKLNIELKPALDEMESMQMQTKKGIKLLTTINGDWNYFFAQHSESDYISTLLNNRISNQAADLFGSMSKNTKKAKVLFLLSLPEFQLS